MSRLPAEKAAGPNAVEQRDNIPVVTMDIPRNHRDLVRDDTGLGIDIDNRRSYGATPGIEPGNSRLVGWTLQSVGKRVGGGTKRRALAAKSSGGQQGQDGEKRRNDHHVQRTQRRRRFRGE